jgi:hypothetical protein
MEVRGWSGRACVLANLAGGQGMRPLLLVGVL